LGYKRREIWVVDSETDPFKKKRVPKPFIWGAYNGIEYHEFKTPDQIVDFFYNKRVIVYAHNGGKFDWFFLLHRIAPFTDMMIISGRLSKFKIGECEYRDSINILPIPLSAYKKDEFDYSKMEKEVRHLHMPEIKKYLKNDCVYLYEVVMKFIEEYGLNLTLASSALKKWQKISKMKAPKTNKMFYNEIYPYYYGGRVQPFVMGEIKKRFKVIDINSAYPFAMKHEHPYGNSYMVSGVLPVAPSFIKKSFIKLKAKATGVFPLRTKKGLNFPNDGEIYEFNITGWEYLTAQKIGKLKDEKIIEVITFYDTINFNEYIDHFYEMKNEMKKKGDSAMYLFAKLFLNSLYGKFGANPEKYNEFKTINSEWIEACYEDGYEFCSELNENISVIQKPIDEMKQRYYNLGVSASITGFVRAYMMEAIHKCKGVMYCDTDSIACEDTGDLELDGSKLGAWDVEAVCDYGAIAGKKLYAFQKLDGSWKTASKGVRLTAEELVKIAKGEEITAENTAPTFSIKKQAHFISRRIKIVS